MAYTRIPADLFSPQKRPALFNTTTKKPDELQLAVEAARLAYFRFEDPHDSDPRLNPPPAPEASAKEKLEAALGSVGFTEIHYIDDPVPSLRDLLSPGGPLSMPLVLLQKVLGTGPTTIPGLSLLGPLGAAVHELTDGLAERFWNALSGLPAAERLAGFTDTQAFVAFRPEDHLALVAVRGSQANTVHDVVLDARFLQVHARGWTGALHHGFARGATVVWDRVQKWLNARATKPAKVLVTGHSLGAAIATLIAVRTHELGIPTRLVTIGSPRVGDQAFADDFTSKAIDALRIVDGIDVVTHIPPKGLGFLQYCHVGTPLYIDKDGIRHQTPTPDNTVDEGNLHTTASQVLLGPPLTGPLPLWLADHAPANYLRAIWP